MSLLECLSSASVETSAIPCQELPAEFAIGDRVASDWLDENNERGIDFGEIRGMRYLSGKGWEYFVCWTHATSGAYPFYPYYDGEATSADELVLMCA